MERGLCRNNPSEDASYKTYREIIYLRAKVRVKKIVRGSKREAWRNSVSTVTIVTPIFKIWEKIWKISGSSKLPNISGLSHYPPEIQTRKARLACISLNLVFLNDEAHNLPLSRAELDSVLSESEDSSPFRDAIYYQMMRHFPEAAKRKLFTVFNRLWRKG